MVIDLSSAGIDVVASKWGRSGTTIAVVRVPGSRIAHDFAEKGATVEGARLANGNGQERSRRVGHGQLWTSQS